MTIHYPKDYRMGEVLVSIDNRTATKVSVWYGEEDKPRKRYAGDTAYEDAMDFAYNLADDSGYQFPMPTAESVAIALGGATFDDSY